MQRDEGSGQAFRVLENVVFLHGTTLFAGVHTDEIRAIASIAEELSFDPGEVIVRENDVGDSLYLIKDGSVRIEKKIDERKSIELAELKTGECFGDMSVFDAEVRSASVIAGTTCSLLRVGGEELLDVILESPYIAIELLKMFVKRLRNADARIQELTARLEGRG